ncbi:MAG: hypothetical protein HYY90_05490 [Candidatus Omnitrophica bacterium]|nr:hypothetical protein [Candidatus Omnitrophota bacterium]MBI3083797.1 hypothetical protein [Candidatus Omnitrophota bacterium]
MERLASSYTDVHDMLCAQALTVVAAAMGRLERGAWTEVRYNAEDVRRDLLAWARERAYPAQDAGPGVLRIQRSSP